MTFLKSGYLFISSYAHAFKTCCLLVKGQIFLGKWYCWRTGCFFRWSCVQKNVQKFCVCEVSSELSRTLLSAVCATVKWRDHGPSVTWKQPLEASNKPLLRYQNISSRPIMEVGNSNTFVNNWATIYVAAQHTWGCKPSHIRLHPCSGSQPTVWDMLLYPNTWDFIVYYRNTTIIYCTCFLWLHTF